MPITYNADEIFEMAMQIERNGARFYRKAAGWLKQPGQKDLLLELAAMEDDHLKTFTAMRDQLTDADRQSMVSDPYDEAALYLQAIADGHVFDVHADPSALLTGKESLEDVLHKAIDIEKDSVVFYVGMREQVPARLGKDRIDRVIREEISHIARLSAQLAAL